MKNLVLFAIAALFTAGCAIVPTEDKEAFAKVKKVAIVGYTLDYNMDMKDGMLSSLAGNEDTRGGMGKVENKPYESAVARATYDNMVKTLQAMKWTVVNADKVTASPTLQAFHAKNMKWGSQPLQPRHERQEKMGIPQHHHMNALVGKKDGPLPQIAKELGVDTLAFVYVETNIYHPVSMGAIGMGNASYAARTMVDFYDPVKNQLIMRTQTSGDELKEAEGAKGFPPGSVEANSFSGVERATGKVVPALKRSM